MRTFTYTKSLTRSRIEKRDGPGSTAVGLSARLITRVGLAVCMMLSMVSLTAVQTQAQQQDREGRIDGEPYATFTNRHGEQISYQEFLQETDGRSVHEDDSLALVAFYHALHGDEWVDNAGWLVEMVEFWVGVRNIREIEKEDGSFDWHVDDIRFPSFNMTVPGEMPIEVENMKYLRYVRMRDNLVGPTVPLGFANIPTFRRIEMRNNLFSSEIPYEAYGDLPDIDIFSFRRNFITGEFPSWLGELDEEGELIRFPKLQRFRIDDNYISGEVPASMANTNIWHFLIGENSLTGPFPNWSSRDPGEDVVTWRTHNNNFDAGPFPDWMCEPNWIDNLDEIIVQDNNLSGEIPECLGNSNSLERLTVGGENDEIGGEVPASLQFATNLNRLILLGGTWTGGMPDWIHLAPSLTHFQSRGVAWTGELPESYAQSTTLGNFQLTGSLVEGGIPEVWQTMSNPSLTFNDNPNMEIGDIPEWMAEVWPDMSGITLQGSGVTGPIPANWENLPNLNGFRFNNNPGMTGPLPSWISDKDFGTLNVSHSGFDISEVPTVLLAWDQVRSIQLGGYGIEGEIPSWITSDAFDYATVNNSLNTLALDGNNFSGPIPNNIGTLKFLDSLNLAYNQLEGELPSNFGEIGQLPPDYTLESLILTGNENLTGMVPNEIVNNSRMRVFEIDDTDLCVDAEVYAFLESIPANAERKYPVYYSIKPALDEYHEVDGNYCVQAPALNVDPEPVAYQFRLHGNYPNPFNPTTTIKYEIPADAGNVRLQVYNVIGQRVATLVNEQMAEGRYEATFDAVGLSSGTYIYRLEAGSNVLTNQMMLIK